MKIKNKGETKDAEMFVCVCKFPISSVCAFMMLFDDFCNPCSDTNKVTSLDFRRDRGGYSARRRVQTVWWHPVFYSQCGRVRSAQPDRVQNRRV